MEVTFIISNTRLTKEDASLSTDFRLVKENVSLSSLFIADWLEKTSTNSRLAREDVKICTDQRLVRMKGQSLDRFTTC